MEASSASLQLSVEQWELLRRLRNSHLTKAQIIRAYDELDRLERELGNLFHTAPPSSSSSSSSSSSTVVPSIDPVSPSASNTQQISPPPSSLTNNKRPHSQTANGFNSRPSSNTINGAQHSTSSPNLTNRTKISAENNNSLINQYEALTQFDVEEEARELQEFLSYVFNKFESNRGNLVSTCLSYLIERRLLTSSNKFQGRKTIDRYHKLIDCFLSCRLSLNPIYDRAMNFWHICFAFFLL